jgi:large subunit ribosomal protein L33
MTIDTESEEVGEMARNDVQAAGRAAKRSRTIDIVKLRSTAGTGTTYVTRKNRRNDPDRLVLRKYDPREQRHVEFREER